MATLKEQGFYMPGEWHPHKRCWMSWPSSRAGYSGRFALAQEAAGRVATAIARFEPELKNRLAKSSPTMESWGE